MSAAVIVAHPDDEILWAGGKILSHPDWNWYVLALCRSNDLERAPRFWRAINCLNAFGYIADLDDGPEQKPLPVGEIKRKILHGLPDVDFDLIMTHSPNGEYTRHLRHEEVSRAVIELWRTSEISTKSLMLFAYEDGNRAYLPRAEGRAHIRKTLDKKLWKKKYQILTDVYGFAADSWEARTTPREEAFWHFQTLESFNQWRREQGIEQ